MVREIKLFLIENNITFTEDNESIIIPLLCEFGHLQIKDLSGGDDVIGLIGSDWHTHSECEGGLTGVLDLIKGIFSGDVLLIKEWSRDTEPRLTIESYLKTYLRWLPKENSYQIFNRA